MFSKETLNKLCRILKEDDFFEMPHGLSRDERRQFISDCANGLIEPNTKGTNSDLSDDNQAP
jgi:hypothetical protein